MEIVTQAEYYSPIMSNTGEYIDKMPPTSTIKQGIRCHCHGQKDRIYNSYSGFSAHLKTKVHQSWIQIMNDNKANSVIENEEMKNTIKNQQAIIAQMEKEIQQKNVIINCLTGEIDRLKTNNENIVKDLLIYD